MSFPTLLCEPLPPRSHDPAGGGERGGEHVVVGPVAGLPVRAQPVAGPQPGSVRPLGEERRIQPARRLRVGSVGSGGRQRAVLLLEHGEDEPQPPAPVAGLPAGAALPAAQPRPAGGCQGAGGQLHAAGQRHPEDPVGSAGEAAGLYQVAYTLFSFSSTRVGFSFNYILLLFSIYCCHLLLT